MVGPSVLLRRPNVPYQPWPRAVGCIPLFGASTEGRRFPSCHATTWPGRSKTVDGIVRPRPASVCGPPRDVGHVCPVGEQSTFVDVLAHRIDRRQSVRRSELDDWPAILERGDISMENERLDAVTLQCREGRVEIGWPAQTYRQNSDTKRVSRPFHFFS